VIRLRVVCSPDRSEDVVELLRADAGTTDVARLPGAALEPPGDIVEADVAREAADGLLGSLADLHLGDRSTITLSALDSALGPELERARKRAPGDGDDAVVWDQLAEQTAQQSELSASFLLLLVIATLIASVGLLIDSQVLIVGAMVLGPEFGPLAAIAVGLVRRRGARSLAGARALAVGFPVAIAVTAAGVWLLDLAGVVPAGYLAGQRPLTSFVSSPDVFSVVVALLAGTAGTVSLTASKSSTLVGVFISVTTVPAAAEIGTALVTGQPHLAAGAAVQLAVNLVCIVVAATSTLALQRAVWHRVLRHRGGGRSPSGPPGR